MTEASWVETALQQFDAVLHADAGFRQRDGQRRMAEVVAQTLAHAELGKNIQGSTPQRAIAVVQAGTGVGKSLAYSIPAIAIALARGTRVVISTATVALQEQLVHKDLPALSARLPEPFAFALAKGRGRYLCKLKLERLNAGTHEDDDEQVPDDLLAAEEKEQRSQRRSRPQEQARVQFYADLNDALAAGQWSGDRDELPSPPEPALWATVAAESSGCTSKHCPLFHQCSYFEKRKELVAAQVIVVNHDLLLSSLSARLLPELDNCLLILDEAHHLPGTALAQFACEMNLSNLAWINQLASRALRIGQLVQVDEVADIPNHASHLRSALQNIERLALDLYAEPLRAPGAGGGVHASSGMRHARPSPGGLPTRARIAQGQLPEALVEPLAQAAHHAGGFVQALAAIAKALRNEIRDKPDEARRLSQLYAQLGALAPRLEAAHSCAQLLLQDTPEGAVPAAKWFTLTVEGDYLTLRAHASPVLPGATLRTHLWSAVRGAVVTSATLTSCGQFDFFLREAGLHDDPVVRTLEVASPFDYARQGQLISVATQALPRDAAAYTAEMVQALLTDLAQIASGGALVLFTSREQMRQAVDALPTALRASVLVQNQWPRQQLLTQHRERVAQGLVSIIFGMQSFGEGLDLPGKLCESLFITKLPFAPPDDPVDEARSEWLRAAGRDPFSDLVVPATAMRLAQWVGRAIRTEEDQAHVYCYDKRLVTTGYGQRLLTGLPPFTLVRRDA